MALDGTRFRHQARDLASLCDTTAASKPRLTPRSVNVDPSPPHVQSTRGNQWYADTLVTRLTIGSLVRVISHVIA